MDAADRTMCVLCGFLFAGMFDATFGVYAHRAFIRGRVLNRCIVPRGGRSTQGGTVKVLGKAVLQVQQKRGDRRCAVRGSKEARMHVRRWCRRLWTLWVSSTATRANGMHA